MGASLPAKAMLEAIEANDATAVHELLKGGYDPNLFLDGFGDKAIHFAARKGRRWLCELLHSWTGEVDSAGARGATPLLRAAESGCAETTRYLIGLGADLVGSAPMAPLHAAAFCGHVQVAKVLIEAGADVDLIDEIGETALHYAARKGLREMCATLLSAGADANATGERNNTPLHVAANASRFEVCVLLIQNGADAFQRNEFREIPNAEPPDVGDYKALAVERHLQKVRGNGPHYVVQGATDKYLTPFQHAVWRWDVSYVRDVLLAEPDLDLHMNTRAGKSLMDLAGTCAEMRELLLSTAAAREVVAVFGDGSARPAAGRRVGRDGFEPI
jgi:hypothetical protein